MHENMNTLRQYVSQFILHFIRFQMNFDKFTMPKVANPPVNGTSCYRQVNLLIVNQVY